MITDSRPSTGGTATSLDQLPRDVYFHLYRYLAPLDMLRLIQTSKRLRAELQTLVWEHCELASRHTRTEDHECFGSDGSRLQVPPAVLFSPEKYSWFLNQHVRSICISKEDMKVLVKCGERFPMQHFGQLVSLFHYSRQGVVQTVPIMQHSCYPSHVSVDEDGFVTGPSYTSEMLHFFLSVGDQYQFLSSNAARFANLRSIELFVDYSMLLLLEEVKKIPTLEELHIVCYTMWTGEVNGNFFPESLPFIKNIALTPTLRYCGLNFVRSPPLKSDDKFGFTSLERLRGPKKIEVPAVTWINCYARVSLEEIGTVFSFPNIDCYRAPPFIDVIHLETSFPPFFLHSQCVETITTLTLGLEFRNNEFAASILDGIPKFTRLEKLRLNVANPSDFTCSFFYAAIDAACEYDGVNEGLLLFHVLQRIEATAAEIRGARYINFWDQIKKFPGESLPDFVSFVTEHRREIADAAMGVLLSPSSETFLEQFIQTSQSARPAQWLIHELYRQIFHIRVTEALFEEISKLESLKYLQLSINRRCLYFYYTPRVEKLLAQHPTLKQMLVSRDYYVYDSYLFCSIMSLDETRGVPLDMDTLPKMAQNIMMHPFASGRLAGCVEHTFRQFPSHRKNVDYQVVFDLERRRKFKNDAAFPGVRDRFCAPFPEDVFESKGFSGWI